MPFGVQDQSLTGFSASHCTSFFFFFWPCRAACGISVFRPGVELGSSAVKARSLNHWTTVGIPSLHFFSFFFLRLWFLKKFYYIFYFWLCWVFVVAHGLSLVAVSGGCSSLRCVGFSLRWLLLLQSTGSRVPRLQ